MASTTASRYQEPGRKRRMGKCGGCRSRSRHRNGGCRVRTGGDSDDRSVVWGSDLRGWLGYTPLSQRDARAGLRSGRESSAITRVRETALDVNSARDRLRCRTDGYHWWHHSPTLVDGDRCPERAIRTESELDRSVQSPRIRRRLRGRLSLSP